MSKDQGRTEPVVTSLPLPSSDSVLVIDLPDGQKLLVGKMPNGSVIEVATWRGTGRPDSRTNRLMLGMNSEESISQDPVTDTSELVDTKRVSLRKFLAVFTSFSRLGPSIIMPLKKFLGAKSTGESSSGEKTPPQSREDDVQLWLNQITERISATDRVEKPQSASTKRASAKKKSNKTRSKASPAKKK